MALLFGMAASSVIVAATVQALGHDYFSVSIGFPPYHIFYGLYMAFTFTLALIAFLKLEKQEKTSAIGRCVVYLGFFWAVVVFATGLACTVLSALMVKAWDESEMDDATEKFIMHSYANLVLDYIVWGFILFQLILTVVYRKKMPYGTARKALYAFIIITTLQQTLYTIFTTADLGLPDDNFPTIIIYLTLFLVEVPIIISILIMFFTGHLWVNQMSISVIIDNQSKLEQQSSFKTDKDNKVYL